MDYTGFGAKLHHEVPPWVDAGSRFHIRIRCKEKSPRPLTALDLAPEIIQSVKQYEQMKIWHITLFLLMPDHLHAILSFAPDRSMNRTVGMWKRYTSKVFDIHWQENFFDHRLRNDEQLTLKYHYILKNPVAAGLCLDHEKWPWWISENRK